MLGLPNSTELHHRISKQKFYEKLSLTPPMKRVFIDQIKAIYWKNKVAPTSINIAPGENVSEIQVFYIRLSVPKLDVSLLRQIDLAIKYHIIFVLEFESKYQIWTAYKEKSEVGNNYFKVGPYYHSDWLPEAELTLKLDGLDIDKVYENFVREIAGDALQKRGGESLKESVERSERQECLREKISALEDKIRKERQLNKQVKLNGDLKELRNKLNQLSGNLNSITIKQ
ncbi:MAG: DUF4391 domain-containing protein [Eubacteriales bacterium]|nr:DUF4391 domain-containing protein [Eubacteriales bacterium]